MERVQVYLPRKMKTILALMSHYEERSESEIVREILSKQMERENFDNLFQTWVMSKAQQGKEPFKTVLKDVCFMHHEMLQRPEKPTRALRHD